MLKRVAVRRKCGSVSDSNKRLECGCGEEKKKKKGEGNNRLGRNGETVRPATNPQINKKVRGIANDL